MPDAARLVPPLERMLYLERVPMLSGLSGSHIAVIADAATERFFPAGTVVFREGEPVGSVHFVVQGSLATLRRGVRVGRVGPSAGAGGISLFARVPFGSLVVADEDTLTLELDGDAVSDVLDDHFPILHHFLREMSRRSIDLLTRFRLDPSAGVPECPLDDPGTGEIDLVDRLFFLRRNPAGLAARAGIQRRGRPSRAGVSARRPRGARRGAPLVRGGGRDAGRGAPGPQLS